MSGDIRKKKRNKKNGIPDRWLDYNPVGQRISGTRFIAFKVPLKPALNCQVPEVDAFGLWDLLDSVEGQNQKLGLIIDLTNTTRYYSLSDVPQSCSHIKIKTEGHKIPSDAVILSFKQAVTCFLKENSDNDKLIGVHCTHGLNRTGYLVCRYLIDVDSLDPAAAVELFNSCRGHHIERKNYLKDLQHGAKRRNDSTEQPEMKGVRGLAVDRLMQPAVGHVERPADHVPPEATRPANPKPPRNNRRAGHRQVHGGVDQPLQSSLLIQPAVRHEERPADHVPPEATRPANPKPPRNHRRAGHRQVHGGVDQPLQSSLLIQPAVRHEERSAEHFPPEATRPADTKQPGKRRRPRNRQGHRGVDRPQQSNLLPKPLHQPPAPPCPAPLPQNIQSESSIKKQDENTENKPQTPNM